MSAELTEQVRTASGLDPVRLGVIYARISSNPTKDELGVKRQIRAVRKLAAEQGIEILAEFTDNDMSAFEAKHRPGFNAMLRILSTVDVVLCWHPDRLTRNPRELEDVIDALDAAKVTVRTVEAGHYDLSNPSGRMIARQIGAVARYESELKRARIQLKMEELAMDPDGGKWKGGRRPFGFEDDGVTHRTVEVDLIREAARRIVEDSSSVRSIVAEWNAAGITTSSGKRWHPGPLRNLLASPRIAGLRVHRGKVVGKAEWKPVLDEVTYRRVVAALDGRSPVGRRGRTPQLLTGTLVCGALIPDPETGELRECGARLVAQRDHNGTRRYACRKGPGQRGCGKLGIKAEPLEHEIRVAVMAKLDDPDALRAAVPDLEADEADLDELAAIDARRLDLASKVMVWSDDLISKADADLERQKREVEARLASRSRAVGPLDLVAGIGAAGRPFDELDTAQQRSVIGALIERVVIGSSLNRGTTRFEVERIHEPVWRVPS